MGEGRSGVVRRVDVDALDLAGELLLQRLEGQQVVAEDQPVVEEVAVRDAVGRVVGAGGVLQEDAGLETGAVLLADPGQLEPRLHVITGTGGGGPGPRGPRARPPLRSARGRGRTAR